MQESVRAPRVHTVCVLRVDSGESLVSTATAMVGGSARSAGIAHGHARKRITVTDNLHSRNAKRSGRTATKATVAVLAGGLVVAGGVAQGQIGKGEDNVMAVDVEDFTA